MQRGRGVLHRPGCSTSCLAGAPAHLTAWQPGDLSIFDIPCCTLRSTWLNTMTGPPCLQHPTPAPALPLLPHLAPSPQLTSDLDSHTLPSPPPALQISLFLAEPVGSPKVLLPQGLGTALQLATAAELPGASYWPRVHAFNLLRLAFNESQLALDTSGYFAGGRAAAPWRQCTAAGPVGPACCWQDAAASACHVLAWHAACAACASSMQCPRHACTGASITWPL